MFCISLKMEVNNNIKLDLKICFPAL